MQEGGAEPGENWPQARQELSIWAFGHRIATRVIDSSKGAAIIRVITTNFEIVIGERKSNTYLRTGHAL